MIIWKIEYLIQSADKTENYFLLQNKSLSHSRSHKSLMIL